MTRTKDEQRMNIRTVMNRGCEHIRGDVNFVSDAVVQTLSGAGCTSSWCSGESTRVLCGPPSAISW